MPVPAFSLVLALSLGSSQPTCAAPGDLRWEFPAGAPIRSTPAVGPEGTVYFGCTGCGLYAVDGGTGVRQWKFTSGPIVASHTVGPDGTVYVAEERLRVHAIDPESGTAKWRFTAPYRGFLSSPALTQDGVIHVLFEHGRLVTLAAETGQELCQFRINDTYGIYSSPAVGADGAVYPGTNRDVWHGPVLGADDTLYVIAAGGRLQALDGAGFSVSVETHAGMAYRLKFKDSLRNAESTPLTTTVVGDGSRRTLTDSTAASAQRFYRLRTEITSPR